MVDALACDGASLFATATSAAERTVATRLRVQRRGWVLSGPTVVEGSLYRWSTAPPPVRAWGAPRRPCCPNISYDLHSCVTNGYRKWLYHVRGAAATRRGYLRHQPLELVKYSFYMTAPRTHPFPVSSSLHPGPVLPWPTVRRQAGGLNSTVMLLWGRFSCHFIDRAAGVKIKPAYSTQWWRDCGRLVVGKAARCHLRVRG